MPHFMVLLAGDLALRDIHFMSRLGMVTTLPMELLTTKATFLGGGTVTDLPPGNHRSSRLGGPAL
jgi:hypothetical protein